MIWGCFSWYGVGPLVWIKYILDQFGYIDILEKTMLPYVEENLPLKWTYQQDNDPKHTSKRVKKWFADKKVDLMTWPAQSPDLNLLKIFGNELRILLELKLLEIKNIYGLKFKKHGTQHQSKFVKN